MWRIYPPFVADPGALGLLILRIITGLALVVHGYPKVVHAASWMSPQAAAPAVVQVYFSVAEFAGGLLLIAGLFTPVACVAIMINMLLALFAWHLPHNDPFVAPHGWTGQSYELALVYFGIAFALLLVGPGEHSFDNFFFNRAARTKSEPRVPAWR